MSLSAAFSSASTMLLNSLVSEDDSQIFVIAVLQNFGLCHTIQIQLQKFDHLTTAALCDGIKILTQALSVRRRCPPSQSRRWRPGCRTSYVTRRLGLATLLTLPAAVLAPWPEEVISGPGPGVNQSFGPSCSPKGSSLVSQCEVVFRHCCCPRSPAA